MKQSKQINVKYFYIKEKVDLGEVAIDHYPMEQMWMDINSKPKQDSVFWELTYDGYFG